MRFIHAADIHLDSPLQGLLVKGGTLVDATLVAAQPRPPRKEDERSSVDPEGEEQPAHLGYKLHLGVSQDSSLIRKVEVTPASTYDSQVLEPLLSGDEQAVYADKAYDSKARRKRLRKRGVFAGILKQARRNRALTEWERTWNRYLIALRSPVERVFGTLKRRYGFDRARNLGLARNRNHALLLALAFNMRKAVRLAGAS